MGSAIGGEGARRGRAQVRASARLRERVRHRMGSAGTDARKMAATPRRLQRAAGEGLVLIGTSTGGPPALEALLTALPATFPWPIPGRPAYAGEFYRGAGSAARRHMCSVRRGA